MNTVIRRKRKPDVSRDRQRERERKREIDRPYDNKVFTICKRRQQN